MRATALPIAVLAILVPWQTEPLEEHATTKTDEAFSAVNQKWDELEQLGAEAEEAAHEANRIKEEAYRYDCGSETNYCMYGTREESRTFERERKSLLQLV